MVINAALSYSGTFGFIAKCLQAYEPGDEPGGEDFDLPIRTSGADSPSATRFIFFM